MPKKETAKCLDCKVDTLKIHEFYMVRDRLWDKAVPEEDGSMEKFLCIGCLEKRLKRKLQASDFKDVPLNWPSLMKMSARLLDRLKAAG